MSWRDVLSSTVGALRPQACASKRKVRDFLRHRDVQTTQQWYAYRLANRKLPTIGMTQLLPESNVVAFG